MQGVPQQLFPSRLSQEGITAHLYYEENEKKLDLQCISCHLDVGHYDPNYTHAKMQGIPPARSEKRRTVHRSGYRNRIREFYRNHPRYDRIV